jgi:hypothetical protein
VVISAETGLYIVDAESVRWAKEKPVPQTVTKVTSWRKPVVLGLDGLAVSTNSQFLAYVENGEIVGDGEIVVRAIADGSVFQRTAVQSKGHTTLRAISPDGIVAALVTVDPQMEAEKPGDEVPWTVTVVDLTSGTATLEDTLANFVRQRIEDPARGRCGLTTLSWLPKHKLLIGMSGDPYETYLYDPTVDRLMLIPELQAVWSQTSDGLVLGRNAAGTEESAVWPGGAVIWNSRDGSSEPVILDPAWPHAGAGILNADGTALALMVAKSAEWEAGHGWQVFRPVGSKWRPDGPVTEVAWMNQPPALLSKDSSKVWTAVYQSTGDNETVLLSHDFPAGVWEEWFRAEDRRVGWGSFSFVAIVPAE